MADDKVSVGDIFGEGKDFDALSAGAEKYANSIENIVVNLKEVTKLLSTDLAKTPLNNYDDIQKTTKAIDALNKTTKAGQVARLEEIKLQKAREKAFDDYEKKLQKASNETTNYTKRVRELTKELATVDPKKDAERYRAIAKEAGELKDKINDARDAVKVFAKDSKAATAKTLFGQIVSDIGDLDFAAAADKAKIFAGVIKSMTFAEVIGGIKNFGKALLDVGRALIANPFTIMLAGVVALGIAIKGAFDSMDAGVESLKALDDELKKVEESTRALIKANRDLSIQNDIEAGKTSKREGERTLAINKFKDEYIGVLAEQREATKKFNDEIQKEREDDGFKGTKALYEFLGGETELTKRQKIGLAKIEEDFNKKKEAMQLNLQLNLSKVRIENDKADSEEAKKRIEKAQKEWEAILKIYDKNIEEARRKYEKDTDNFLKEQQKKWDAAKKRNEDNIDLIIENDKLEASLTETKIDDENAAYQERLRNFKIQRDEQGKITEQSQRHLELLEKEHQKNLADIEKEEKDKKKKEELKATLEDINKDLDLFADQLKKKQDLRQNAFDQEIDKTKDNLDYQAQLAARGLKNTYAFEKAELDKQRLEKIQQQKRDIRIQEGLAFMKLYTSFAEKDPTTAFAKAAEGTIAAALFAGSFYEGTEKVEDDLGKPLFKGKDGYAIRVDGKERIMTGEQNKLIGDMSNDELAALAKSYQDGLLPGYMMQGVPMANAYDDTKVLVSEFKGMRQEISELKRALQERPVTNFEFDQMGWFIKTEISKGLKTITRYPGPRL